jgi:hypothetical protein
MKINGGLGKIFGATILVLGLGCGVVPESARAQNFQSLGQVVTNFTLYSRNQWTNDAGRIFPEDTPLKLSDFAGHVVFFEFFDPT